MRLLLALAVVAAGGGLALLFQMAAAPAQAQQDGEIRLLDHRVESRFPESVHFFVEAAGPDEINDIRVYLKTIGQVSRSAYRQVEFEPGTRVSGEAELLSGGSNYFPPGTRMAYSFEIRDTAGRLLRTEEQIFVYLDTRFGWLTLTDGLITVYYNNPLAQSRAQHVLETAAATLDTMGPVLGIDPEEPLHIVTYHNYRDMVGALPFRSQATREQLITAGMAFSEERVLLVYSGGQGVTGTTAHEFVHLLVADATGRANAVVPAWLNEGLAEYGDFSSDQDRDYYLQRAIQRGELRPLWQQGAFSGTPEDILVGYAQGLSVVTFMIENYGAAPIADLMQALRRTLDIDAALLEVYGFDQYGLDALWRQSLGLPALPRPERPEPARPQATAQPRPTATPRPTLALAAFPVASPTNTPAPAAPTTVTVAEPAATDAPAATATPAAADTPMPTPTPRPLAVNRTPSPPTEVPALPTAETGGGCNPAAAPAEGGELALMLLLVSPAAMLAAARRRLFR